MTKNNSLAGKAAVWLLLTILASACADNLTDGTQSLPEGKYPLEFTSQMYGMEVTRATPDNTWSGTEKIALKVGNDVKQYAADSQGKITAAAGVEPFYWTSTGETKTVSAYYPYSLATASNITVKENQSVAADYQASDALYAASTQISFTATEKKLTFKHLPAKVVAHLKAGDGVTPAEVQGATVKFVSQSLTASFNSSTGVVTATSPGSSSVVSNVLTTPATGFNKSVQALLVPCQMQNKQFIEVTIGSDKFYYTPTTATDGKLESGKAYTYEITVKRDGIEVELTESGAWGNGGNEDVQSRSLKMSFTIDLTPFPSDMTYILPFSTLHTTGAYTLTVDWGDGASAIIPPTSSLSTAISHSYAEAREYTITISTNQANFSQAQITPFGPGFYQTSNDNPKKLKSFNTPLLYDGGAGGLASCFRNCTNLTSIPADLFVNYPKETIFFLCFDGCNSLASIPKDLFANNPEATNFQQSFSKCSSLTSIPEDLFANNPKVTTFYSCFRDCTSLTGPIPKGLFANNPEVTTFEYTFYGCSSFTSIPANLFDNNSKVTTFSECFRNCTSLTGSIPEGLFANNLAVTSFYGCFMDCTQLTLSPNIFCDETNEKTTRFKDKTINFYSCFLRVGSHDSVKDNAGTAPALWEYAGTLTKTICFSGVGKTTNTIPNDWK